MFVGQLSLPIHNEVLFSDFKGKVQDVARVSSLGISYVAFIPEEAKSEELAIDSKFGLSSAELTSIVLRLIVSIFNYTAKAFLQHSFADSNYIEKAFLYNGFASFDNLTKTFLYDGFANTISHGGGGGEGGQQQQKQQQPKGKGKGDDEQWTGGTKDGDPPPTQDGLDLEGTFKAL